MPRIPAEISCPAPTLNINNRIGFASKYAFFNTQGIMIALTRIGGIGTKNLFSLKWYERKAAIKVARLPNITSRISALKRRLLSRHPMVTPGMAAGVK
jgi:hypothetical protein